MRILQLSDEGGIAFVHSYSQLLQVGFWNCEFIWQVEFVLCFVFMCYAGLRMEMKLIITDLLERCEGCNDSYPVLHCTSPSCPLKTPEKWWDKSVRSGERSVWEVVREEYERVNEWECERVREWVIDGDREKKKEERKSKKEKRTCEWVNE